MKSLSTHPFGNPVTVNGLSWRQPREALGTRWINTEPFIDDSLKVRELLRRGCVNISFGRITAPDFLAEFVVGGVGGPLEQIVRCGCKKGRYGLTTRDAEPQSVSSGRKMGI